jgi:hypothetical protein
MLFEQESALAGPIRGWQDVRKMNATRNHFFLARAVPSPCGHAEDQVLVRSSGRRERP